MRIDMNTPVDILMHSDNISYIDLDEGELMHWKYIKREKLSNGKWRYYYDQSELDRSKASAENAKNAYNKASLLYARNKSNIEMNTEIYRKTPNTHAAEVIAKSVVDLEDSRTAMEKASKKATKLTNAYKKKAITSFAARTVSKGFVKIANLMSGLSKKKK